MPFRRSKPRFAKLPEPYKPLAIATERMLGNYTWYQGSTGQAMACDAYDLAGRTRDEIAAHQGSVDDVFSLVETLESLYVIGAKLDQIDRGLSKATANTLAGSLLKFNWHERHKDWAGWQKTVAEQSKMISAWTDSVQGENKQRWFAQVSAQRAEVVADLLESFQHMQSLHHDFSFLHTASSGTLLPDFALEDTKDELLTSEGAAAKARALAEGVAKIELPPLLSDVGVAQDLPAFELEAARPELG